jgi:hypothetical protein
MQHRFEVVRWTPDRLLRIAHNQISPAEVEEVLADPRCHMRVGRDGRILLGGRTEAGRFLMCVLADEGYGVAGVVTARYLTDAEGRIYRA